MNNKLDINTIVGFVLIGAILMYFGIFSPDAEELPVIEGTEAVIDSTNVDTSNQAVSIPAEPKALPTIDSTSGDSAYFAVAKALYGPFAKQMLDEQEKFYNLENEVLRLKISSLGAQIVEAELKNYKTYDSLPLYLIKGNADFSLPIKAGKLSSTSSLNFSLVSESSSSLSLAVQSDEGAQLVYNYTLPEDSYMLDVELQSTGMSSLLAEADNYLRFEMKANRHEKNRDNELTRSEFEYRLVEEGEVESFNTTSTDEEISEEPIEWVAYRQQFFSTILQSKGNPFAKADMALATLEEEGYTKFYGSKLVYPRTSNGDLALDLGLYLGPNKYEILESYGAGFEELVPLGWGILGWINRYAVLYIFNFLEDYGINYGLIILIIALVFKMVLFPLTYSSYRSMAKMRVLKPEIDELNEKYDDAMKKQQAQLELYNKAGVSPLGGCLPMLLQFPILIALFQFFPAAIELRQQSFLWASDLSSYDSIYNLPFEIPFYGDHVSLFTLLMTISTLIYTYMNQQLTGSAQNQQFPQMKYIIYLMPVMFLGVFNNYAAGLSYYYFVANMITFGQQFAIRSFIDEDKIKAKIAERKERPQKENRLMRRMKEVQDQQNRQQRRKK